MSDLQQETVKLILNALHYITFLREHGHIHGKPTLKVLLEWRSRDLAR